VEQGGGESGGDAKSAEACWKRVFEVEEVVGTVESQVRADGRSIVRVGSCYREVKCGCGEVESSTAMRRCNGEAQSISAQRNNTWVSNGLIDVLLLSRRIDRSGVIASATPLRSCVRAFGGRGCRSCCASMEEEERPSKRWARGLVNRSSAPSPLLAGWPRDGSLGELLRPGRQALLHPRKHPHRRATEMDLCTIDRLDCSEGFRA
jgi:hypothetical protein